MKDSREAALGFDEAVDAALANIPVPEELAGEDVGGVDDGTRDASSPTAPQLRAVKDEPEAEAAPAEAPKTSADPRTERAQKRGEKYSDFLDDLEANPALRRHVMAFWGPGEESQPGKPQPAVEDDDPLAGYDEQDRNALTRAMAKQEKKFEAILAQALAPFQEQMAHAAASQEFESLSREHPDWKKFASKEDLADVRAKIPGLSLLAAYRMTGLVKELADVRAHVSNADRQVAKVSEVLKRKHPAESTPRRHVKVEKREVDYDDAFELAYARKKAASGSPGR